ncbi:AAA family ATPase [Butyrivibrio sp. JL13D10]|uniref:AAA family ATPase n=1 Tax=Butyrivibrio sp. JL13D10 TaxID=3236815 RepID=UPI0038B4A52C
MAKKLISFNFNGDFVPELETLSKSYPLSEVSTTYCTTAPSRMKEYSTDTYLAEAIANYLGSISTMHLFVGKTAKNEYVAEYKRADKDETQICIGQIKDGQFQFKAGIISETGLLSQYVDGHKGTMFAMAMFPEIAKDSEAMSFIDILKNYDVSDENYSKSMCGLSNNMYYRLKDEKSTSPVRYEQEPKKLSQADIDAVKVSRVFCGEAKIFNRTAPTTSEDFDEEISSTVSTSTLRDMFPLDEGRVLSAEEEARVPNLGDWYVVPEWSMKTAKRIAASNRFRKSIRNILLYGPSGTGKTEGSQAIAEMLGLPYYTQTCSPDDDKFDILGQLIPNTGKGKTGNSDEACKSLDIPTFSDVENDFKASFMKLFGKEPGKLDSESDCY